MKKVLIAIILLFITSFAYSDEVRIPFSCYPKELQANFAKHGKKLDLSGNDRTPDSWGFIQSQGSRFSIFTYRSVTKEEFDLITEMVTKGESCHENNSSVANR